MRIKGIEILISSFIFIYSCASSGPTPTIKNINEVSITDARGVVLIGPFFDKRQWAKGDPTYVGTIRGGYGNPIERLHIAEGVPDFVIDNIRKCLWYYNIRAEALPKEIEIFYDGHFTVKKINNDISSPPILVGLIQSVLAKNSIWGGHRYFEVMIDLYLINQITGKIVWQASIVNNTNNSKYKENVGTAGISDNLQPTREWLSKLIQDRGIEIFNNLVMKLYYN